MTTGTDGPGDRQWPVPGVRAAMDGLNDAVVACDADGIIHYANPAACLLLGWRAGDLEGHPAVELLAPRLAERLSRRFEALANGQAPWLAGRQVPIALARRDGTEVVAEVVLSVMVHPWAGHVVVAIIRPRYDLSLARWGQLAGDLLGVLAAAPVDQPPVERLLATLGRRLHWDATVLWGLTHEGTLTRRQVWAQDPELGQTLRQPDAGSTGAGNLSAGSGGLPVRAYERGEPVWVADLGPEPGEVRSALAFPVRYRGVCVGVIEMLSKRRRQPDPAVVELMSAVSDNVGEVLHAFTQARFREQLVTELQEARRGQEFLLQASRVLSEAGDYRETVERLAQVAVPVLADLCLIDIQDEQGRVKRMAAWHADPTKRALADELRANYAPDPTGKHPSMDVMRTGRSRWSSQMDDDFIEATSRGPRHVSILKELGFTAYMTVPLAAGGRVLGTVTLCSAGSGRRFGEKDLMAAEELARQVASVVERARVFDREQRISHDLQRNLLPEHLPAVEGWSLATRYLPAAEGAEVGGDWFDVVDRRDGSVALVVGDVEGHDMGAAKVMGILRHVLWLLALEEPSPSAALLRLNRFLVATRADRIATVLMGVLDTSSGKLTLASAGHPPPLVVGPTGGTKPSSELAVPPGPPLGVPGGQYPELEAILGGQCLLMFTDGLVERRGAQLDDGYFRLQQALRGTGDLDPGHLADHVLARMWPSGQGPDDDVAMLAVKRQPRRPPG